MTLMKSIFEIKSFICSLARCSSSKDAGVSKKVQIKYLKFVDRFFRETESLVMPFDEISGQIWNDAYFVETVG